MKVRITKAEWYPCYSIEIDDSEEAKPYLVEVDDAFIERYVKCIAEFRAIQDILKDMPTPSGVEDEKN